MWNQIIFIFISIKMTNINQIIFISAPEKGEMSYLNPLFSVHCCDLDTELNDLNDLQW